MDQIEGVIAWEVRACLAACRGFRLPGDPAREGRVT